MNMTGSATNLPPIQVYSTLSKQKEPLKTERPGRVGVYLCGPTVYKPAHMGHMVGPIIFDTIKRYLTYCGYKVTWVVNITDVDDKLIAEANKRGIPMRQVAEENIEDYLFNLKHFGVTSIDQMPKATEHMDDILSFIGDLVEKGFAYASDGDVFFDVMKDSQYGKLSNRSVDDQQGEGGEAAARKRSPGDFALWKSAKPGEPYWESPWGKGRPGWHIECSAMSRAILGETFEIHGGGLDLLFPHHENEIAQSECRHGRAMAHHWMHNGLMRAATQVGKLGGRSERQREAAATSSETDQDDAAGKMSRSKGAGGLADLVKTHGGELLRFFLVRTHYRSTIIFGEEQLTEAKTALDTFYRFFERYGRITKERFYDIPAAETRSAGAIAELHEGLLRLAAERRNAFLAHMDDDFNTGAAMSELFELVRALNKHADTAGLEEAAAGSADYAAFKQGAAVLKELSAVLGLFLAPPATEEEEDQELVDGLVRLLIELRAAARKNKDFATADRIRGELAALGITLEDRKGGTDWRKA